MNPTHHFRSKRAVELYPDRREHWDKPLFGSKSFVAVPSVGALVEGWLLIVPRQFALSVASLSGALTVELVGFLGEVAEVLEGLYGPLCVFEHGPAQRDSRVGCGVDYAHLHLVPLSFDLLAEAGKIAKNVQWAHLESLVEVSCSVDPKQDYWFVEPRYKAGTAYLGTCKEGDAPSQLFRRAIANQLGKPGKHDWKQDLGEKNLLATVRALSGIRA